MSNSSPTQTRARSSRSNSSISLTGSDHQQQYQTVAKVTGDKELLWSRLREADSLQGLLALAEDSGFHPVVLPRRTLLRDGVAEADFGSILGQLGVFGAILDCKTAAESMQRELVRRELSLVKLGLTKHSINLLMCHLDRARNVGKAACLVIDDRAPPATTAKSVFAPLHESRHLLASGLPAVIFGSEAGTLTRIEDREDSSSGPHSEDSEDQRQPPPPPPQRQSRQRHRHQRFQPVNTASELPLQQKRCEFTDMMLVAYESSSRAAA